MSWDWNEYEALIQGATMRQIDELERAAQVALFNRVAQHKKGRLKIKQIFDAEKARKMFIDGNGEWKKARTDEDINKKAERAAKEQQAWNEFMASGGLKFTPK
jgi:hypothetical protein